MLGAGPSPPFQRLDAHLPQLTRPDSRSDHHGGRFEAPEALPRYPHEAVVVFLALAQSLARQVGFVALEVPPASPEQPGAVICVERGGGGETKLGGRRRGRLHLEGGGGDETVLGGRGRGETAFGGEGG